MQYDTYLEDAAGHPLASYGPRKLNGNVAEECPPEAAEFWGVYRHVPQQGHAGETVYHAECVGDAHDKDSAHIFADMVAREETIRAQLQR